MSSTLHPMLNVAIRAARAAGAIINRAALDIESVRISQKQVNDFVTEIDHASEDAIIDTLLTAYPHHGMHAEESGTTRGNPKADHVWIIDPLDGTTNFLHAIPHFAINIALQREGVIVAAVTYNPITNELFWAEKGKGCFVNDKRLRVAGRKHLDESVFGTGIPFLGHGQHARFLKELHQISQRVAGVRRFGAASLDLAYVAAGRLDGFWERDLKPWDMAAGVLMITEAGGKVTNADGGDDIMGSGSICAANLELHPLLIEKLKAAA